MVTGLSALTGLDSLSFEFRSLDLTLTWGAKCAPTATRSILLALSYDFFVTFFHQIDFNRIPQPVEPISRTPRFRTPNVENVNFDIDAVEIGLLSRTSDYGGLRESDRQLSDSSLPRRVYTTCLPSLSMVENLFIDHQYS